MVFKTPMKAEQITCSVELGTVTVDDLGIVKLNAHKDGNQITVQALQSDGTIVGKAETVVGISETPLYLMTAKGLTQVTIRWGKDG